MSVLKYLRHPDRVFALVLIAICAVMYLLTGKMEEPTEPGAISASTFPLLTLLGIVLICLFIIIKPEKEVVPPPSSWKGMLVVMLTAIYIALIEPIGFFIVTPIFLFVQPLLENFRRFKLLGISVALITVSVYLLFDYVLAIPLPTGIFGD